MLHSGSVQEVEESFGEFWAMEGAQPFFPKHYPTSCLLGCVEIHDCLRVSPEFVFTSELIDSCCFL